MSGAFLLLSAAPSGISRGAPPLSPGPSGLLVTVAEVDDARATVWLGTDDGEPVRLVYGPAERAAAEREAPVEPGPDRTARARLRGLEPGTRYRYVAGQGAVRVAGEFATAPAPDADAPVRMLWSGDLGGAGHCRDVEDGYRIFRAMAARRADFFVFNGDTIYADQACGKAPHAAGGQFVAAALADFHRKHRYNRADHAVQAFLRRTPVYAIWDDHEVRNNFAGAADPLMPVGRRAFQDYWAVEGPPAEPGRLYRSVRWGRHVEVFILDTRQYRTPNAEADGPAKTMLGAEQRAWLLDGLAGSTATWKLVVSSVPLGMFTGGAHSDSWSSANVLGFSRGPRTGFVHERGVLLAALRERQVANVAFLTGDVHRAELIRHEPAPGQHLHEFVAGPLSARQGFARFLDRSLHSRSLASLGWTENFGEVAADGRRLTVRIVDASGSTRVSLTLPAGPPLHVEGGPASRAAEPGADGRSPLTPGDP
jgi:alkaline phosphatase D